MKFTKTTCTQREPSFTRVKKSSGTSEPSIADFNWSLFIPVPKGTQASKLCVCVFSLACLFLWAPSGSKQKWFSANFVPLRSVCLGLFDCTYITTDKPLLTLALPITNYKFPLKFLEQSSGVLSNCIFVNGKQPCSPSWRFRTMPMTSCNGSIFHLPRLLDFLHCCSLQMWAQRWIYRAGRIQWSTQVSS